MNADIINVSNSNEPLVSIIMPVYNAEKYLKGAIISLLKQTYRNFEIICVNDGSTDHSGDILHRFANADERIKLIEQQNSGPAKARNVGLDAAKGKYICFMDADDRVENNMYEKLVFVAEHEKADIVVFGGSTLPDWESAPQWIKDKLSPRAIIYSGEKAGVEAIFKEKSSTPFLWLHILRRDILERPTRIRLREDLDLGEDQVFQFAYFPRAKKIVYIQDRFYLYRWNNEGSLMWRYNNMQTEKFRKHLCIVNAVFTLWKKNGYDDIYGNLATWMVNFLYYDLKKFPKYLQVDFAKQIVTIAKEFNIYLYMCNEYEFEHGQEIEELAIFEEPEELIIREEIAALKCEIERIEDEIHSKLTSKSFKLGRMLTHGKKRLDISSVMPPKAKKN